VGHLRRVRSHHARGRLVDRHRRVPGRANCLVGSRCQTMPAAPCGRYEAVRSLARRPGRARPPKEALAGFGRLLRRRRILSDLPAGGYDREHEATGRHGQEEHRRGPQVLGSGGSEAAAEAEGTTPVASSAHKQASANATPATPARAPKEIPACVNGPKRRCCRRTSRPSSCSRWAHDH
jgi:hypothetical protein